MKGIGGKQDTTLHITLKAAGVYINRPCRSNKITSLIISTTSITPIHHTIFPILYHHVSNSFLMILRRVYIHFLTRFSQCGANVQVMNVCWETYVTPVCVYSSFILVYYIMLCMLGLLHTGRRTGCTANDWKPHFEVRKKRANHNRLCKFHENS